MAPSGGDLKGSLSMVLTDDVAQVGGLLITVFRLLKHVRSEGGAVTQMRRDLEQMGRTHDLCATCQCRLVSVARG